MPGLIACGANEDREADRYVRELNEIQDEGVEEGEAFAAAVREASNPTELEIAIEQGIDANEDAFERMGALDPPAEVANEHQAILDLSERLTGLAQKALDAVRAGDRREFLEIAAEIDDPAVQEELLDLIDQINETLQAE